MAGDELLAPLRNGGWIGIKDPRPQLEIPEDVLDRMRRYQSGYVQVKPPPWRDIGLMLRNPEPVTATSIPPLIWEDGQARVDEWSGAVLRIQEPGEPAGQGRLIIYRITRYLGNYVWLGEWPD